MGSLGMLCLGLLVLVANLHSKCKQARICELQRLTVSVDCLQETKTKFLGQPIYVAIREVSRPDRKITLNMVEATQRLAYRNLRVSALHLCLASLPCRCDFNSWRSMPPHTSLSEESVWVPARAAFSMHLEDIVQSD